MEENERKARKVTTPRGRGGDLNHTVRACVYPERASRNLTNFSAFIAAIVAYSRHAILIVDTVCVGGAS